MKHGHTTNGKTTTLYGDNANDWIVQRSGWEVDTILQAEELIFGSSGKMQLAYIAYFDNMYLDDPKGKLVQFKWTKKYQKRADIEESERETLFKVRALEKTLVEMKAADNKVARSLLKIPCSVCDKPINKGAKYKSVRRKRAHTVCLGQ